MTNAADTGITKRKIMVTAWVVNRALYSAAVKNSMLGWASWIRISNASIPPMMKNTKAVYPYMMPIRLWSTVVIQDQIPVVALGRRKIVVGRSAVAVISGSPATR